MSNQIIVFDLETSGLDPMRHGIVQVGALFLDRQEVDAHLRDAAFGMYNTLHFNMMADPRIIANAKTAAKRNVEFHPQAFQVNGFTMDDIDNAPPLYRTLHEFDAMVETGAVLAGWNAALFDIPFLKDAYRMCRLDWRFDYHALDFWGLAYALKMAGVLPQSLKLSLQPFCDGMNLPSAGEAHTAHADAFRAWQAGAYLLRLMQVQGVTPITGMTLQSALGRYTTGLEEHEGSEEAD